MCVSSKGFMHTITYFFVYSPHRINGRGTGSLHMRVQVRNLAYILIPLLPCYQLLASLFSTCLDFTFSPVHPLAVEGRESFVGSLQLSPKIIT